MLAGFLLRRRRAVQKQDTFEIEREKPNSTEAFVVVVGRKWFRNEHESIRLHNTQIKSLMCANIGAYVNMYVKCTYTVIALYAITVFVFVYLHHI